MITATLERAKSDDQGTPGSLLTSAGFRCATYELPDLNDQPDISCIPFGSYQCVWLWSDSHKRFIYHVLGVRNRTVIEIHAGNFAGNVTKGYVSQVKGCCILGSSIQLFKKGTVYSHESPPLGRDQKGVVESVATVKAFEESLKDINGEQQEFTLIIRKQEPTWIGLIKSMRQFLGA